MPQWGSRGWHFTFPRNANNPVQLRLRDIEREPNGRVSRKKKIEAHIDQR